MSEEVYEVMKRVLANRKKPKIEICIDGYTGFLFLDKRGMPMMPYQWEKRFQRSVEKYNKIYRVQLPKITPHVCRHTFCTNMAKRGISVETLKYLMGHTDISVTLNVYTHLKLEDAEKEIKRLEQEQQMCLLELSLNLKNRLKVYSGQDSFILMPAATRPRPHS